MNKRVSIAAKPAGASHPMADEWVSNREVPISPEEMKRLTIDITKDLHTAIKTDCARRGVKMADEIRDLLERHFLRNLNGQSSTEKQI